MKVDPIADSKWKLSLVVEEGRRPIPSEKAGYRHHNYLAEEELRKQFRRYLGLPIVSDPWPQVFLDEQMVGRLLEWVEPREKENIAHFARGHLTELPQVRNPEWYLFQPHHDDNQIERDRDGVECIGWIWPLVSNEFVRFVREQGLTGFRFVPDREQHRFRQRRNWFWPIPTSAIGRGVDHPWFDRGACARDEDRQPPELRWFHATSHFDNAKLRPNPPHLSPSFRRIIDAFPAGELTIHGAPRVPRHHLPHTDFAMILALDFRHDLCMSARSADLLRRKGLITEEDLSPLVVLDDARPQVSGLEAPVNLSDYGDHFSRLTGEHDPPVAPPTQMEHKWTAEVALAEARRELEKSRDEHPLVPEQELAAAIEKAGMQLPELWRKIIVAAGEFGDVGELYVPPPDRWMEELDEYQQRLAEAALNPASRYLYVGSNESGDIYALELPARDSDVGYDAPLLFYDHEIFRFTKRWPSITRYLEESFRRE